MPNGYLKNPVAAICIVCGKTFIAEYARHSICSDECRDIRIKEHSRIAGKGKTLATRMKRKLSGNINCAVCGWTFQNTSVIHGHHILPKSWGGKDEEENIVMLCPNHHAVAHDMIGSRKNEAFLNLVLKDKQTFIANIVEYENNADIWKANIHRDTYEILRRVNNGTN